MDTAHAADNCGACGSVCPTNSQCVQGDCKSWGTPVKVADGTALAAAMDDQGNVFVAYMGGTDRASVYVRRKPSGGTWSGPHLLDGASTRGDFYTRPSLDVDNAGNALITWGSQDGYGYSRYRTNNDSWTAPAYVPTPAGMGSPRVAMAPAGDAIAAWDNQVASAGTEVWLRGWGGASEAWYGAQSVSEATSSCLGSVGADPDGTALIVYSEDAEVHARWWSPVTRDWLAAPTLLNEGYCFVSMAFDGDGTSVVASAGSENIYGSIATTQTGWTTEVLAPPGEFSSYRNHVSAFAGRGGDAIVAIEQIDDYASVVAITWSAAAASWQGVTPLLVGTSTAEFRNVSMALDATGNGFVVSSNVATGAVVGRRRSGATGDWEDVETLGPLQGGAGSTSNSPLVKVSDRGSAVLVWGESDGGDERTIWSRHYE